MRPTSPRGARAKDIAPTLSPFERHGAGGEGATHLVAKDKDETWVQGTDPRVMVRVLNSGESFYRLSAPNPVVRALVNLLDRLCGSATH